MIDVFFIGLSLGSVIGVFMCLLQSAKNRDLIMRLDAQVLEVNAELLEVKRVVNKMCENNSQKRGF